MRIGCPVGQGCGTLGGCTGAASRTGRFCCRMIPLSADSSAAHRRAVLMMVVAATCWSSGGILVRQLSITNAWEIVFWRSLAMATFVLGTLAIMHRRNTWRAVQAVGLPGVLSGMFLAGTFFFFIASLTHTTVANTFVLMSVSPFLAALAGRVFLHEPVPLRTWIAMSVAFAGIVAMFADSVDGGRISGNLLALGVSCCFALNVTVLRRIQRSRRSSPVLRETEHRRLAGDDGAPASMLPTVMLAGVFSLVPAFLLAGPLQANAADLAVLGLMGCVQLGTGCLLMTAASRHLSATELGLLALLEPILGPVWVWLLMTERPSSMTLLGAAVVLSAVMANEAFGAWRGQRARMQAAASTSALPPA